MLLKETAFVRLFGLTQIPLLAFVSPRVERLDDDGCEVEIPLGFRTKNHLGSMYFGVLSCGADLAGGVNAALLTQKKHKKVQLVFKTFSAEYLKRADGDTRFTCNDGRAIREAVEKADATGERITVPLTIVATVPSKYGSEPVARFQLGLSLKRKG